jgi:hypothetical protein
MLLGVMLFFDGALLALGNVWTTRSYCISLALNQLSPADSLRFGLDVDHWTSENILLLRAQAKNTRDRVLHRRDTASIFKMAIHWDDC